MRDLLVKLGKRVQELRAAKKWSQEEFAHISGFHRTYVGQIERGEKNISFGNLVKVSSVLGVTIAELTAGLEDESARDKPPKSMLEPGAPGIRSTRWTLDVQKLLRRLRVQRGAMDLTMTSLEELTASGVPVDAPSRKRLRKREAGRK